MRGGNSVFRRHLLRATFLSTTLMTGVPYARAQTCSPTNCIVNPGQVSISGNAAAGTGDGGTPVSLVSPGTVGNIAVSGTSNGGSGANGADGTWYWEPWKHDIDATGGQAGGNAGSVTITNSGAVTAPPAGSAYHGVSAGAVGAQGGVGGNGAVTVNGADGGQGGAGGTISITNAATGTISIVNQGTTSGLFGISANAGGGQGGKGGGNGSVSDPGTSGKGGSAGSAYVGNAAVITTQGFSATAIHAAGVGGMGGNGVTYQNTSFVGSYPGSGGNGAGFGQIAGAGLQSGQAITIGQAGVGVVNTGALAVAGASASGIYANASGGNGGNSGDNSTSTGGTAGNAGTVFVSNSAAIVVSGSTGTNTGAAGLFAIAAGGTGGQGGYHIYPGGMGGNGGNGGFVTVVSTGAIQTSGTGVADIYASATGGQGGKAGFGDGVTYAGGAGGKAGTVYLTHTLGTLQATGAGASNIMALAVGGAGGALATNLPYDASGLSGGQGGAVVVQANMVALPGGGANTSGTGATSVVLDASGGVGGAGRNGGHGGNGGTATLNLSGTILVTGDQSSGVSVLTQGGNGGTAGVDPSGNRGAGGIGGAGNTATVVSSAAITVQGAGASGILVNSSGGLGGVSSDLVEAGTVAGGAAGTVFVTSTGVIQNQSAAYGTGILAIAGGGAACISDAYCGPGAGGNGGNATVKAYASVTTAGTQAAPQNPLLISSQAIAILTRGGNGGYGSYYHSAAIGNGGNGGSATLYAGQSSAPAMALSTQGASAPVVFIDASGGGGGSGGLLSSGDQSSSGNGGDGGAIAVKVASNVTITSAGTGSAGIVVRSVGGDGGGTFSQDPQTGSIASTGGNGGTGGVITLHSYAAIVTSGNSAPGIYAISAGGAGGGGGGCDCAGGSGAGGAGGSSLYYLAPKQLGNTITIVNGGRIGTSGTYSSGIVVQTLGGAGGPGDGAANGNGGASGNISVENLGAITTKGDSSHGIMAYSIGGGGGPGSSTSDGLSIFVHGGQGGDGGAAGATNLTNSGGITTYGASSNGLFAFSVGGGGGAGNSVSAMGLGAFDFPSVTVALGGAGGDGATGGAITLNNNVGGNITTYGTDSAAIRALSLGGTGGTGGSSSTSSYALGFGDADAFSLSVTIAGTGGTGGNGGAVSLTNAGSILTGGGQSAGLLALSIGGGGGDGGNALSHTYAYGVSTNVDFTVTLGGTGGHGGGGGDVSVNNTQAGSISTTGFASDAIAAFSIGGGGGLGGTGVSHVDTKIPIPGIAYLPLAFSDSYGLAVTLGGDGGQGGSGGTVSVTNNALLATTGIDARGIFAQSVGGGGGNAAAGKTTATQDNTYSLTIGGSGGAAGGGGEVQVTNTTTGVITTQGDGAHGIFAQSVGGGGGMAGTSSADTGSSGLSQIEQNAARAVLEKLLESIKDMPAGVIETHFMPTTELSLAVGGNGGAGGNGGPVDVYNYGKITTSGDLAIGVVAQSVGGGGGAGGGATVDGTRLVSVNMAVGGNGGAAGYGAAVVVTSTGAIATAGDSAFGVLAQSIGGGGGVGGIALGGSQLIFDPTITLGGAIANASNSTGGSTTVTVSSVATQGNEAHGVVAQSIGGGGGLFYLNQQDQATSAFDAAYQAEILAALQNNPNVGQATLDVMAAEFALAVATSSGVYTINLGGSQQSSNPGTATGSGGTVTVVNTGTISTTGANAFGILAQSIGGGGGFVTDGSGVTLSTISVTGQLGNASIGNALQTGGSVIVQLDSASLVTTQGNGATAIVAQSIGGGGGYTGALDGSGAGYQQFLPQQSGAVMSVGANSQGGSVSITSSGTATIQTVGDNAHGIVAQSLSGGGGLVGNAAGLVIPTSTGNTSRNLNFDSYGFSPGAISIDYAGAIRTYGADSIAIFAQSGTQGTSGAIDRTTPFVTSGAIDVTIGSNSIIMGGSGSGAAIVLDGGGLNTVTVGDNAVVLALSGLAISAPWGTNVLNNSGFIQGDVILGSPGTSGAFNNGIGATYQSQLTGTVNLGAGTLTNAGVIDVAGPGVIGSLALTGTLVQSAGGSLVLDVQGANPSLGLANANDQISVSAVGTIGGVVNVNVMNSINPGDSFQILSQAGPAPAVKMGDVVSALTYSTVNNGGATLTWTATATDTTLSISPNADFTPTGAPLNPNQLAYAQHLQSTWNAGGSEALGPVYAELAHLPSLGAYERALSTAMPSVHATGPLVAALLSRTELGSVLSCPQFQAMGTLQVQGDCAWARVDGGQTSFTPGDYTGFTFNAMSYRMGAQKEVAPGWFVSLAANYTNGWGDGEFGYSSTEGQEAGVSAALKREIGPWLLSGAVHLGYGRFTADRQTVVGGTTYLSDAAYDVFTAAARLRADYQVPFETWYLKPFAQVDLIYLDVPGFSEGGHLSPYDLAIAGADNFSVALGPHLEIGARLDLPDGSTLRPYGTVGATWFSNAAWDVAGALRGAPVGAGTFTSTVALPDVLADLGLGLQWSSKAGVDLRLNYDAQLGSDFVSQSGSLRFSVRF